MTINKFIIEKKAILEVLMLQLFCVCSIVYHIQLMASPYFLSVRYVFVANVGCKFHLFQMLDVNFTPRRNEIIFNLG